VTTIIFKKALVLSLICGACCATELNAQVLLADTTGLPVMEYGAPKSYEIGGVKVAGAQFSDANSLVSIAGFKVGSKIKIPGPACDSSVMEIAFVYRCANQSRKNGW
jgi:hypothetical protein